MLTGEQIRGARAMLRLDQRSFATLVHVTVSTVKRMEQTRGPLKSHPVTLEAVRQALEAAGVEIVDAGQYKGLGGPGIRLKGTVVVEPEMPDPELEVGEERAISEVVA